ncbi:MAG TPA: rod shape-determining protein MreC [Fimbriimonadaceae bacterium]|nr:rod shape-determining protein MreC [Fimbriimonadaceae bacterium]
MAIGRFQTQSRNAGESDPITLGIRTVYSPVTHGLTSIADGTAEFWSGIVRGPEMAAEIDRLRELEQAALLYQERLEAGDAEIARLRQMLDLPPVPGKTSIAGAVVGYFPLESRATLDIGRNKGLKKGMPVVSIEGLYGIVQTVDARSCQVMLISSPQLRIVGKVERDPPPVGFVRGQSVGVMIFEVLDSKALPQTGDTVVTSGFSDRIPAGIPIGKIVQIEEDAAYGSKRCQVFPGAQVGATREVFVLR